MSNETDWLLVGLAAIGGVAATVAVGAAVQVRRTQALEQEMQAVADKANRSVLLDDRIAFAGRYVGMVQAARTLGVDAELQIALDRVSSYDLAALKRALPDIDELMARA